MMPCGRATAPADLTDAMAISSGFYQSLILRSNGTVVTLGFTYAPTPGDLSDVKAVAAGTYVNVALKGDGTVVVWGDNIFGGLDVPPGLSNVVAISAGIYHVLALKDDGTVVGWGGNMHGQLNIPAELSDVVAISAGPVYSAALKKDGTVVGWGSAYIPSWDDVVAISASGYNLLGVKSDGTVLTSDYDSEVEGMMNVISVSGQNDYNLLLRNDGRPAITVQPFSKYAVAGDTVQFHVKAVGTPAVSYQWRLNGNDIPDETGATLTLNNVNPDPSQVYTVVVSNDLGYVVSSEVIVKGTPVTPPPPESNIIVWGDDAASMTPPAGTNYVTISAGHEHALAIREDGTVVGWGDDAFGRATPPGDLTDAMAISSGFYQSMIVRSNGTIVPLGFTYEPTPALNEVTGIAAGVYVTAAVRNDGTVAVWGDNSFGQLGVPPGLSGVVAVSVGWYHVMALRNDGTVVAWGGNMHGQLDVPPGLSDVVAISAGPVHSVALKGDGSVVVWGSSIPLDWTDVVAISGSGFQIVGLKSDGTVLSTSFDPVPDGLTNIISVSSGTSYNLALRNDGRPAITVQPYSKSASSGDTVQLHVMAIGYPAVSYQWRSNGVDIADATSSTLTLTEVTPDPAVFYTVVVSNELGSVVSSAVTVTSPAPNAAPTDIAQSNSSIAENQPAGTTVGTFSTVDENQSIGHVYTLVSGTGSDDNSSFVINGDALKTAAVFDYETKTNYTIRVRTTDFGGEFYEEVFSIAVTDVDDQTPTVKVLAPGNGKIYPASLLINGTISDNGQISYLRYSLNNGSLSNATLQFVGTGKPTNWSATINLKPGTNLLAITASDLAGNQTNLAPIKFYHHVVSPLLVVTNLDGIAIDTNGVGEIVNGTSSSLYSGNNTNLFVGRTYTLKAIETGYPNYILSNWTATWQGQASPVVLQTNNVTCTFEMHSNMVIRANFVSNPFNVYRGMYFGLFANPSGVAFQNSGAIQASVNARQGVSGKIFVDGNIVPFAGKVGINGIGSIVTKTRMKLFDKPELTVNLTVNLTGGDIITGSITESGGWTSSVEARRVIWSSLTGVYATDFTNAYTFIMPGSSNGPVGSSYATITVNNLGRATAVGASADGHAIKASSIISKEGFWPFFSPQYRTSRTNAAGVTIVETEGFVLGWLQFTNVVTSTNKAPVGELHWINTGWTNSTYAAGFANTALVRGSRWLRPVLKSGIRAIDMTNALVTCSAGNLASPFGAKYFVATNTTLMVIKPVPPSTLAIDYPNSIRATLSPISGALKGTFIHPLNGSVIKWSGAVLQDQNYGEGFFMGPTLGGQVNFDAAP